MNTRRQAQFRRASLNSMILSSLFVGCLSILFVSADLSRKESGRSVASFPRQRVDLSADWSYAPDPGHRAPGDLPTPPSEGWKSFDPQSPWKYSDEIHGSFWFKKAFEARWGFQSPALVLGQIPGSHRVYLNGRLIGGSDEPEPLAFYSFDPSFLNLDGQNTVLVSSRSRPALQPGVSEMQGVGMFIGDTQDVRQKAMSGQTRLYVSRSVSLALTVGLFLAALGFAIFRRAHRHFFYGALVLLLSSLHIAHFHPWIAGKMDLSHLRLLQAAALALAPFALCSACLHLRRKYFAEGINNGLALVFLTAASAWILSSTAAPELRQRFHFVLMASAVYALAWVAFVGFESIIHLTSQRNARLKQRASQSPVFETLFVAFASASGIAILTALSDSPWAHFWTQTWALALPLVFSFLALVTAALEHAAQHKAVSRKTSRDQLVLGLIRLIHDSPDVTGTVVTIQNRVSAFLKAQRSTLYILDDNESSKALLKATYIRGDDQVRSDVSRSVAPDKGIIGYACTHRSPLLIEDVRRDPRFADELAKRAVQGAQSGYRTGACMILPLVSGSTLLGVLTFADKKGGVPFSREDFAIALEVSNDLAVLLDSRQLQESLRDKSKSHG